jgi:hypothetical protein
MRIEHPVYLLRIISVVSACCDSGVLMALPPADLEASAADAKAAAQSRRLV